MALRRRSAMQPAAQVARGTAPRSAGLAAIGSGPAKRLSLEGMSRRAPAKSMPQQKSGGHSRLPPATKEVIAAVESLYADQLKPYGRILRKRLSERAQVSSGRNGQADMGPDVDIRQLRAICGSCACLRVEDEEGGDWSAVLVNRKANFVDIYSPSDDYPPQLWDAAAAYFESLTGDAMTLPGGRYACAQVLISRKLPFLAGRSLGQVCHIVQLAISQKKVLGYLNGSVVPYGRSQSMVKEHCAIAQQPCAGPGRDNSGLQLADWKIARSCLQQIIETAASTSPQGLGVVPLSNVKRLFRSRFGIELSETMLGHSKLSELLQDPKFADICRVKLEGHGYIVMQQDTPPRSEFLHSEVPKDASGEPDQYTMPQSGFSPNEPAKIFPQSSLMCRRRPAPLSFGEPNGEEDREWMSKMMHLAQSPGTDSLAYTDSTSAETRLPSPMFSSELFTSPRNSLSPGESLAQERQRKKLHMPGCSLPPPPYLPPPPPPGLTSPASLLQAVRPPPGLPAPPGFNQKHWAKPASACDLEIAFASQAGRARQAQRTEEDSPPSAGSGMVVCLSDHV
eukprot:TRINITY_DN73470_c0_g1_i1.p1 TRINITY_DN73470_c0_g1~~TRINITY_DN73470_c0_g1_i1.p1  ORF type:complete len:565 (+),score=94.85 TRINITY_DN73470_c0_g1_i1:85-1779(+)